MSKRIRLAIFCFVLIFYNSVASQTTVTLYKDSSFRGESLTSNNLENVTKFTTGSFQDKATSLKITSGSCAIFYTDDQSRQESGRYFASTLDDPNIGSQYNDKISSISSCGTYSKVIQCPAGQFVKKISWSSSASLRTGIELHCYLPSSLIPSSSHRSLNSSDLPNNGQCTVIRGIRFQRDTKRSVNTELEPVCQEVTSDDYTYSCRAKQALVGISIQVENFFNYVKSSDIVCRDVSKIESICVAYDKLEVIITCNATNADAIVKCSQNGIVGYGLATDQTEDQRTEYTFYQEFGFDLEAAAVGLFENFKSNIGTSKITGYDWTAPSGGAFEPESTIPIGARAAPGCITKILEIVGKCSFMEIRPNHLERFDECDGSVFVNEIVIPKSVVISGMSINNIGPIEFVSDIPDNVAKFLYKKKMKNVK